MTDHERELRKQELFEIGRFGIEVENFLESNIGQYLLQKARENRSKAVVRMKEADVTNAATMQEIKNQILIPELVLQWLAEAIGSGLEATAQLDQEEKGI